MEEKQQVSLDKITAVIHRLTAVTLVLSDTEQGFKKVCSR